MTDQMANLDPALEAGNQPNRFIANRQVQETYHAGRRSVDNYRQEAGHPTSTYSSNQATPQPYYHNQPSNHASGSASGGSSTLASPNTQAYVETPTGTTQQQGADSAEAAEHGAQDDSKRPRACEACRGLKVRCDQDPARPDIPCKRCAKAGRACVITQPSRKRQKKADSRVAELEKKLDALTAVLNHRHSTSSLNTSAHVASLPEDAVESEAQDTSPRQTLGFTLDMPEPGTDSFRPSAKRKRTDDSEVELRSTRTALDMGEVAESDVRSFLHHMTPSDFSMRITSLIPLTHGAELFKRYNEKMVTHLPVVVFPKNTSAEQVFKEKPILYLAIISAASFGKVPSEVSFQLQNETMGAIADVVVRNGAKSLELIQAMQIVALWYKPPEDAERTNFYQLVHMAAVMALDIGLGKRFNPRKQRHALGKDINFVKLSNQNSDSLEARRAWLGCYYLCAT